MSQVTASKYWEKLRGETCAQVLILTGYRFGFSLGSDPDLGFL